MNFLKLIDGNDAKAKVKSNYDVAKDRICV